MGKFINSENANNYVGNPAQLNNVKYIQFLEGKAAGMKAYEVTTASGFSLTVAIDRGLDIPELKLDGQNISFMSSTGLVNSTYFSENRDLGFMRNFNVGFLTTGGLSYMGSSSENQGLHGTISNTPAHNYSYQISQKEILIQGYVTDTSMFGPNLILHRQISLSTDCPKIRIHDILINDSDETMPYMVLYHNNYGYPFLNPDTKIKFDAIKSCDRNYRVVQAKSNCMSLDQATKGRPEQVFFHKVRTPEFSLISPKVKLELNVKYSGYTLPILNEWKLARSKNYVLGMEPGTNDVNGFEQAKKDNKLNMIEPDQRVEFNLVFEFRKVEQ